MGKERPAHCTAQTFIQLQHPAGKESSLHIHTTPCTAAERDRGKSAAGPAAGAPGKQTVPSPDLKQTDSRMSWGYFVPVVCT